MSHPACCAPGWSHHLIRMSLVVLLAWNLIAVVAAQTASASTNWLTLTELLKKWEPVPLQEIQHAAEKGDASAAHYLGYCHAEGLRVARNPNEGMLWYQRALQAGYLPSANNLGLLYQRGLLGSNDLGKAVYYYKYAAEQGLAQAQVNLGILYRDGYGVPTDSTEAMRWFQLAAKQGHPTAMVEIGRLYRSGRGVARDLPEAIRWFQLAVKEKDSPLARLNLGLLYQDEGQIQNALPYFQQAAEQGLADAMIQLYFCYRQGNGVTADHPKAVEWLTKAAEDGNAYAECLLGYHYEYPEREGTGSNMRLPKPSLIESFRWYRRSAEQDWAGGQYHLGLCYLEGKVVELDEARGLELIRAAADQGLEDAVHELADLYARGVGEPRSEADRPIHLLQRARAWSDLIFRYEHGLGTERDLIAAAQYYCHAAMSNSRFYVQYSLVDKIEFNQPKRAWGTPIIDTADKHIQIQGPLHDIEASDDVLRALSLYLKSANGDGQAALQIGNRYLAGQDAPKSATHAWTWFALAAQNGSTEARAKITGIESHMAGEELKTGKQLLVEQVQELNQVASAIPKSFESRDRQ